MATKRLAHAREPKDGASTRTVDEEFLGNSAVKGEPQLHAHAVGHEPVRRKRLPFRLLTVLDLVGLAITGLILSTLNQRAEATAFQMNLTLVGFCIWLLLVQIRSLATILTHTRYHALFAPMIAGALVLGMSVFAGTHYSVQHALVFVLVWTAWLGISRLVRHWYLPQLRILTFGSPQYVSEIQHLPGVNVIVMQSPPDGFDDVDVVALDPVAHHGEDWMRWLIHADMAGVKLISAPLVVETLTRQLPLEALHGHWAPHLFSNRQPAFDWKRLVDVLVVLALAPILLVVFGLVAIAVFMDDGRPILFWQTRIGRSKLPFKMAKIRSMRADAEANGAVFATRDDPRVTRVGSFIRRYRLDEIPQFWNVLIGDMSIVGPRPEQLQFSEYFERTFPLYSLRYNQRPGITGWAQVRRGYADNDDETYGKLRYDLYYVRHVSPLFDIIIMLRTIGVIIGGFGAR